MQVYATFSCVWEFAKHPACFHRTFRNLVIFKTSPLRVDCLRQVQSMVGQTRVQTGSHVHVLETSAGAQRAKSNRNSVARYENLVEKRTDSRSHTG